MSDDAGLLKSCYLFMKRFLLQRQSILWYVFMKISLPQTTSKRFNNYCINYVGPHENSISIFFPIEPLCLYSIICIGVASASSVKTFYSRRSSRLKIGKKS